MNLKYYLRGLGTGVAVTAVIMGIALGGKEELSDEQIKQRASELGMVEEGKFLKDLEQTPETTPTKTPEPTPTKTPEATPAKTPEVTPTKTPEATPAKAETEQEQVGNETKKEIDILINGGDGSYTVCKRLEEQGLVKSAKEYDAYLCNNGFDKKLVVGTHTIPTGATDEEIAKLLTSK